MKYKRVISFLMVILIISMMDMTVIADSSLTYDAKYDKASSGLAAVGVKNQATIKTKLIIQKDQTKYTYNIKDRINYEMFPLQMGDGTYSLKVYENTTGTKYKNVYSSSSTVDITDEIAVFLTSNQQVKWSVEDDAIKLAQKLIDEGLAAKKAQNKNAQNVTLTDSEKLAIIYKYIIANMDYDYKKIDTLSYDYIPDIDTVLADKDGICFDYSVLFAAMLRSQGIPAKLIKGYSTSTTAYHAWNEVYLSAEKRWIIIDTTYDAYKYDNKKSYTMEKALKDYTKEYEF